MEGLHIALRDVMAANLFRGAMIGSSDFRLSHLFYADDVIIVSNGDQVDMDNIIRVLHVCYMASDEDVRPGKACSGCMAGSLSLTYLGLPIGSNMNRVASWKVLVNRFKAKLLGWKASLLSISGRLTLIKSVLGSLGNYYMSIFKAPKTVIKELERLRASFFWGANEDKKKLAWVKWSNVIASFNKGGDVSLIRVLLGSLGLRLASCDYFNRLDHLENFKDSSNVWRLIRIWSDSKIPLLSSHGTGILGLVSGTVQGV
ncbi:hypothetical protein Tco_0477978 [Tanacetum coccineum]